MPPLPHFRRAGSKTYFRSSRLRSGSELRCQHLRWPLAHLPAVVNGEEANRNPEVARLRHGSHRGRGFRLPAPASPGPTGRAQAVADRRSSPGGGGGGGWCPGGLAALSSRSHEAPEPHQGMDKGKMDENEWGYHGEGNKSLVVAHAQVSGRQSARSGTLFLPVSFSRLSVRIGSASSQHPLPALELFPQPPSVTPPGQFRVPPECHKTTLRGQLDVPTSSPPPPGRCQVPRVSSPPGWFRVSPVSPPPLK